MSENPHETRRSGRIEDNRYPVGNLGMTTPRLPSRAKKLVFGKSASASNFGVGLEAHVDLQCVVKHRVFQQSLHIAEAERTPGAALTGRPPDAAVAPVASAFRIWPLSHLVLSAKVVAPGEREIHRKAGIEQSL